MSAQNWEVIGVLWGEVLQYLHHAECIRVVGSVCKTMHDLIYSAEYWGRVRQFCFTAPMAHYDPILRHLMFSHMKAVRSLRFEFPFSVSPETIESVLQMAFNNSSKKSLQVLDVSSVASSIKLETFRMMANKAQNIEDISFANSSSLNHERLMCFLQGCQIKHLNLANCVLISTQSLFAIAEYLLQLETIWLESCDLVDDAGISRIALRCKHLRKVSVSFCRRITNLGIRSLLANPSLQHLEARYCHISDRLFDEERAPRGGSLKHLDIKASASLTDSACFGIALQFPALETVDISLCPLITSVGVWDLLRLRAVNSLKPIKALSVTGCRVSNDDHRQMGSAFPETQVLLEKTQKLRMILDLLARGWSLFRPQ
jgi:hypothetical protein